MSALLERAVYTRVKSRRNPDYQVLGISEDGKALLSEEQIEHLCSTVIGQPASIAHFQEALFFTSLENEKNELIYLAGRIVVSPNPDEFNRLGVLNYHLIFAAESEFAKLNYNPFILFEKKEEFFPLVEADDAVLTSCELQQEEIADLAEQLRGKAKMQSAFLQVSGLIREIANISQIEQIVVFASKNDAELVQQLFFQISEIAHSFSKHIFFNTHNFNLNPAEERSYFNIVFLAQETTHNLETNLFRRLNGEQRNYPTFIPLGKASEGLSFLTSFEINDVKLYFYKRLENVSETAIAREKKKTDAEFVSTKNIERQLTILELLKKPALLFLFAVILAVIAIAILGNPQGDADKGVKKNKTKNVAKTAKTAKTASTAKTDLEKKLSKLRGFYKRIIKRKLTYRVEVGLEISDIPSDLSKIEFLARTASAGRKNIYSVSQEELRKSEKIVIAFNLPENFFETGANVKFQVELVFTNGEAKTFELANFANLIEFCEQILKTNTAGFVNGKIKIGFNNILLIVENPPADFTPAKLLIRRSSK